ncbi:MAG: AlwI family type II restriction endonuclease, partial [Candidatus Magasanikbacteria bacterium]
MANLTKTKTLFGFTSPRTLEKIIPEISILTSNFSNSTWSGNKDLQIAFFDKLFESEFYEGESYPSTPDLAARDRITRAPKALGFVDLKPTVQLTEIGSKLLEEQRLDETFTRQLLKFQLPSPYHTQSKHIEFKVKPYLELLRLINDLGGLSKTEIALFFLQLINIDKYEEIKNKIINFRGNSKSFHGSRKMYVADCFEKEITQIFNDEIINENIKTRESDDISLKKFLKTKQANLRD